MMRSLYDNEYLASGCTIPYNENTNVDNLTWTWATCYALAGVAFTSAAVMFTKQRKKAILMILFFVITGVGYAVTGASHQFAETREDWEYTVLFQVGTVWVLFGNAFLMRTGILFFFFGLSVLANTLWVAINAGIIAVSIIFQAQQQLVADLALGVTYLCMCILYGWVMCCWGKLPGSKWSMCAKILAMLANIAALAEQNILSKTCGSGGYEDCFADCPLANPTEFNHNAISHILLMAGILLLTTGELGLPTHILWDYYGPADDISDWETRASLERKESAP